MWLLATDITTEHFILERNCKVKGNNLARLHKDQKILQLYQQRSCCSQPSWPNPGFPPGRLCSDIWTGHLGQAAGNGRLSQAGGFWVLVQCLSWNNQCGHMYGKQGVRPAGLTCPVLLTPFPLLWGQITNCCLWSAESSVTGSQLTQSYHKFIQSGCSGMPAGWCCH